MDDRLKNFIDEHSNQFYDWTDSMNEYNKYLFSSDRTKDLDESYNITLKAVNNLASIFEIVKKFGRYKDEWDYSKFYQNVYGFDLIIKSKKIGTSFYFGLDEKGFYIRTELNNEANLKNMKDNFWKQLLSLTDYEGFEFSQYEGFSKDVTREYPELFYTYKGMIFQIFRKYFFDSIDTSSYSSGVGSLGEFRITWTGETPFDIIIAELCQVFKTLYELKYSLWKIDDLRKHKK